MAYTLPAEAFAALAPSDYFQTVLLRGKDSSSTTRPNGREPLQFRPLVVNTQSLVHCHGSAVVRAGGTVAVCGLRGEILPAAGDARLQDLKGQLSSGISTAVNLLIPNVELSTGCNASFLPGTAPSDYAQSIAYRLLQQLQIASPVKTEDLIIRGRQLLATDDSNVSGVDTVDVESEVVARWLLRMDIVFLSLDGNAFDVAWRALQAALANTRLPMAWFDEDLEMVVCSSDDSLGRSLRMEQLSLPFTFAVFDPRKHKGGHAARDKWIVADPDGFEESMCAERLTIVYASDMEGRMPRILRIEKEGGTAIDLAALEKLCKVSNLVYAEQVDSIRV